jgi:hypothetical protein
MIKDLQDSKRIDHGIHKRIHVCSATLLHTIGLSDVNVESRYQSKLRLFQDYFGRHFKILRSNYLDSLLSELL